ALGITCIFSIYIFKNIKEYGIMKSMGVRPGEIVLLISAEIVLVNLLALFLGSLLGVFSVLVVQKTGGIDLSHWTSHNQYFIVSGLVHPRLTAYSLLFPPGLALFFSFLASVWPCIMIIRQHTVDLLRTHG
ncbi:MAG: FtsX-like permease family protein, partial [Desulfohalobiaceae bacterium]|nr:FtsX-like permease family protein [Desulfohalobiaceae bacterium]